MRQFIGLGLRSGGSLHAIFLLNRLEETHPELFKKPYIKFPALEKSKKHDRRLSAFEKERDRMAAHRQNQFPARLGPRGLRFFYGGDTFETFTSKISDESKTAEPSDLESDFDGFSIGFDFS